MHEGLQVQLMLRDPLLTRLSARASTSALLQQIKHDGKEPLFALYMDCAGRIAQLDHLDQEDASEVQRLLNEQHIPLLGFYCRVEIAPQAGKSRGLDWSGILVILSR
jgi:small ligand-binding sensory domain FIST